MKREISVDLHGLNENEAYLKLLETLNNVPKGITRIIVIHGYHGGNVLKNMVKNEFFHYKILEKCESINPGETIFFIDQTK